MIKLKELLIESGVLVKNKKTGNVYRVKKSNPEKHDAVDKKDNAENEKFNKDWKDYDDAPDFGESEEDFNEDVWRDNYIHQTEGGSTIIGTAHGHRDDDGQYVQGHPDNYSIENHVIPEIEKRVEEARKAGKKVTFLTEGGKSDEDPYAGGGGDEQHHIATKSGIKFDDVKTWDGENSDISNPNAPIYDQIAEETGNTKEEEQAFMFANMFGQDDEDSVPADKLTKQNKKALRDAGYKGGFPPGSGNGEVESLDGDADYEADKQLLYLMSYPGDFESGHEDYKFAEEKYGREHLESLLNGKAGKSAKAFNRVRDRTMKNKIEEVESDGDTVAIVVPGSGHAYSTQDAL